MTEEICPKCILLGAACHFDILQRPGPDWCNYPSVLSRRCMVPLDRIKVYHQWKKPIPPGSHNQHWSCYMPSLVCWQLKSPAYRAGERTSGSEV